MSILRHIVSAVLLVATSCGYAEVATTDDAGQQVRLHVPAVRIISLSPHITELLFAAGAGDRIVGVVDYSDFPAAAKLLPRIGSATALDAERIASLKPDLIVAWGSGNPAGQIASVRRLKVPLFISEPKRIDDIADTLRRLGILAASGAVADLAADNFDQRLATLRAQYSSRATVRVFYEIWHQPLMTVGGAHVISHIIELCGGENIFREVAQIAPALDMEAVVHADPEVIIASGLEINDPHWLDVWRAWPQLQATRAGNLYAVPPDLLQRHTPRILDGAQQMCEALEAARRKRNQAGK
jgi:iron complex transport system substrate-binding protein